MFSDTPHELCVEIPTVVRATNRVSRLDSPVTLLSVHSVLMPIFERMVNSLFIQMPIFVSLHLGQTENSILTLPAVVMRLLSVVGASWGCTVLRGGVLFKTRSHNTV